MRCCWKRGPFRKIAAAAGPLSAIKPTDNGPAQNFFILSVSLLRPSSCFCAGESQFWHTATCCRDIPRNDGPRKKEKKKADRLILTFYSRLLVESECSPNIQQVLCHILQPPCHPADAHSGSSSGFIQPPPRVLPPCRSICMAAASTCHARLGLDPDAFLFRRQHQGGVVTKLVAPGSPADDLSISLKDLLRCELFPVDDGMGSCTAKPGKPLSSITLVRSVGATVFRWTNGAEQLDEICTVRPVQSMVRRSVSSSIFSFSFFASSAESRPGGGAERVRHVYDGPRTGGQGVRRTHGLPRF